jgi:2-methylisocitrate lyase-like PEP mutase family enzyme
MVGNGEQVIAPGTFDVLTAKVVVALGYNGVYLGGGSTSASLGTIEALMTMSEQIDLARRVAAAIGDIPLIVDGHTGFGNAAHIARAVREFEGAGVAAIHIEDQPFPKRVSYHKGIKHMVSVEEMQERIAVACSARRDPDFVIIARTEARGAAGGSLEQAIERLRAYREAGADMVMPMPHGREEAEQVRNALPDTPLMWFGGMGSYAPGDEVHIDVLKELGYQLVAYPVVGHVRAINAIASLYVGLRESGVVDVEGLDDGTTFINGLIGVPEYYDIEIGASGAATTATH